MIVWLKVRLRRSNPAPSCVSEANGNGEEHGHGDAQGDGDAQGSFEEQGEVQGHGKDQADLVFEYEGRLIRVRISTNKQSIEAVEKAEPCWGLVDDLPGLFPGFNRFDKSRVVFIRLKKASALECQIEKNRQAKIRG